jgi:transcriptional regulator with XRE-family HTH domain
LIAVLRATRLGKGLTQRDVAKKIRWPKSSYAAVEAGERSLSVVELVVVCRKGLEVDPLVFFTRFVNW